MTREEQQTPGDILRCAREEAGLSVIAMAERIGYDRGNIHRVEHNQIGITPEILAGYEEVVGHPLDIVPTGKSRKNPQSFSFLIAPDLSARITLEGEGHMTREAITRLINHLKLIKGTLK